MGIVISYSLRVKLNCGTLGGELQTDVPFKLMNPAPGKTMLFACRVYDHPINVIKLRYRGTWANQRNEENEIDWASSLWKHPLRWRRRQHRLRRLCQIKNEWTRISWFIETWFFIIISLMKRKLDIDLNLRGSSLSTFLWRTWIVFMFSTKKKNKHNELTLDTSNWSINCAVKWKSSSFCLACQRNFHCWTFNFF